MEIVVEFNRASKRYLPGEIVSGRLVLSLSKNSETLIEGLFVRMEGRRFANINSTNTYPEEYYFCEETRQAESSAVLKAGKNEYPFSFILPKHIPGSLEVSRASVDYQIIVTLKVLSEFDKTIRAKFYVDGLLDLEKEYENEWLQTFELRKKKKLGCLWCKNGGFALSFKLERMGYVPGEFVSFLADISNSSACDLDITMSLNRQLHFLGGGNFKKILSEYGLIQEINGPFILPGEDKLWHGNIFRIPNVPPTHLGCRRLIELNYFLKITITPLGLFHRPLIAKIPILIGSATLKTENLNPPVIDEYPDAINVKLVIPLPYIPISSSE